MNQFDTLDLLSPLGVVPIFVNAGAALLPAILALITSVVSLVLRPRELVRVCRQSPRTAMGTVVGIAVACGVTAWLLMPAEANSQRRRSAGATAGQGETPPQIDWAAVAVEWIRQEKAAASATSLPGSSQPRPSLPAVKPQGTGAVILGGGPLRNGFLGGPSPIGLTPAWEFPQPGTKPAEELDQAMFLASPIVVDDAVYGGSCLVDAVANYGAMFCLDAATGSLRWMTSRYKDAAGEEHDFKGFFSSPAISADREHLVVGQGLHDDQDCSLLCMNAKTGRLEWAVKTPLHIEGSPAIEGDLAVAGAGAIEQGENHAAQGHPGLVLAVKLSTGQKLWEHQVNDPESSPVLADGVVYIGSGFNGNAVVALRAESDQHLKLKKLPRVLWRTETPHPATGVVTLTDDLVLVGCGNGDVVFTDPHPVGFVLALDRKTGVVRWRVKLSDGVLGRIAVYGARAVVAVRNGEVLVIDLAATNENRVVWRQRISGEKALIAGPAFTGQHVYAISQDGWLAVVDARDGRVLERHLLNAQGRPGELGLSVSSPTIAAGRLYVGSETGGMRCFVGGKR